MEQEYRKQIPSSKMIFLQLESLMTISICAWVKMIGPSGWLTHEEPLPLSTRLWHL